MDPAPDRLGLGLTCELAVHLPTKNLVRRISASRRYDEAGIPLRNGKFQNVTLKSTPAATSTETAPAVAHLRYTQRPESRSARQECVTAIETGLERP
jgi:hypothetical protein